MNLSDRTRPAEKSKLSASSLLPAHNMLGMLGPPYKIGGFQPLSRSPNMPRMNFLNTVERESFDSPPVFNNLQRKQYFDFPSKLET